MSAIVKHGFNKEQVQLIKATIMAGKSTPSDNDLALFGMICQRANLDPFAKQIYAIERAGKWTFQISIDGLRAIAERTGQYAGSDEPMFDEGLDIYEFEKSGRPAPSVCKVTVWKMIGGQRCPFVGIARYAEFCQKYNGKPSGLWEKMPLTMLAKCAESQALRKAFPQCQDIQKNVEAIDVQSVEDETWRINAFEWGTSQGLDMNIARKIANSAIDKADASQKLKAELQRLNCVPVAEVEGL
jgi:phage recombination protein Bet